MGMRKKSHGIETLSEMSIAILRIDCDHEDLRWRFDSLFPLLS